MARKRKSFLDKHGNTQTILIALTIVMFWRGAWGLMDVYFFPNDEVKSYLVSLILGLIILFILNHHSLKNLG